MEKQDTTTDTPEVIYKHDTGLLVTALTALSPVSGQYVDGHLYVLGTQEKLHTTLMFQNGPIPEVGVNGITTEAVLAALIHRTEVLDALFPCDENKRGIEGMKDALQAFEERTAKRKQRGVEGKAVV